MVFKSIKLTNFRQYNDIKIDFSNKINLIEAGNGVGKSTLMGAIIFALYGIEELKNSKLLEVGDDKPLYNIDSNSNEDVVVTLEIETPNKCLYTLNRIYNAYNKVDKSDAYIIGESTDFLQVPIEISKVVSFIPKEFIPLLFFDGERVKTIEDSFSSTTTKFKEEVETILKIDTYNSAKNFIRRCKQKIINDVDFMDPEISILEENIEKYITSIEEREVKKEEFADELSVLNNKVDNLKSELKKYEGVKQCIEQIEGLQQQKAEADKENKSLLLKARKELILTIPNIVRINLFDKVLGATKYDVSNNAIRGIEQSAVDVIVESKNCICGTPLDDRLVYNLLELRKSLPPESFQTILSYSLENKEEELDKMYDRINNFVKDAKVKKDKSRKLDDEITYLSSQLQDDGVENKISSLATTLDENQRKIGAVSQTEMQNNKELDILNRKLSEEKSKLARLLKREEKAKLEVETSELLEACEMKLVDLIDKRRDNMREKMESKVNELANQLLYDEIEIELQKNLKPNKIMLKNGTTNLSTGQRVNVSLAYLFSLMEISKVDLEFGHNEFSSDIHPIILDGVTATLDDEHTKKVVHHIMNQEGQTIIFANTKEVKQFENSLDYNYRKFIMSRGKDESFVSVEVEYEL